MVENKENDLILNLMANPDFTILDLMVHGLNTSNTSLNTKDFYEKNERILEMFKNQDGEFDKDTFDKIYNSATISYNYMANVESNNVILDKLLTYDRTNTFVPEELRKKEPNFRFINLPKPANVSVGNYELGKVSNPDLETLSTAEKAQKEKVFNVTTGEWEDSPNDSFWGHFGDVLVLAKWDYNADKDGNPTDDENKIVYLKDSLKLNENNNPYYETLGDRDIYGREVLRKTDILTTDGSFWNSFDFLDSDDLTHSPYKSLVKNTAIIGSMFIPYVGPAVIGLGLANDIAGLIGTFGKMIPGIGNDSPKLSWLEGFAASNLLLEGRSEYAKQNTWCFENIIGMTGQVFLQLAQARFLFDYAPAIFKGTKGTFDKNGFNVKKLQEIEAKANEALIRSRVSENIANKMAKGIDIKDLALTQREMETVLGLQAAARQSAETFAKSFHNIGGHLFKGYMAGITVQDMYGEAKLAGATDDEAALLTLGYLGGELAILNTGIGELFLPELKTHGLRLKAIKKALTDVRVDGKSVNLSSLNKLEQLNTVKNIIGKGKSIYDKLINSHSTFIKSEISSALGEGIEEVSEEVLADFSKTCFNIVKKLKGEKELELHAWDNMLDRYGMSFIGGGLGGAIMNFKVNRGTAKEYDNMTYNKALQEAIYMHREGKLDEFIDSIMKDSKLDSDALSGTKIVTDNEGNYIGYESGTNQDNKDLSAKQVVYRQLRMLQNILDANGGNISNDSLLDELTMRDLRYAALANSTTAGRMLNEYNSILSEIYQYTKLIESIKNNNQETGNPRQGTESLRENNLSETDNQELKKYQEKLKDAVKRKDEILEGKRNGEFIQDALMELTPFGLIFSETSFRIYASNREGIDFNKIKDERKRELKEDYEKAAAERAGQVHNASIIYENIARKVSDLTIQLSQQTEEDKNNLKVIQDLTNVINKMLDLSLITRADNDIASKIIQSAIETESFSVLSSISSVDLTLFNELYKQINEDDSLTPELKLEKINKLDKNRIDFVIDEVIKNLNPILSKLEQVPYINSQLKNTLNTVFDLLKNSIYDRLNRTVNEIRNIELEGVDVIDLEGNILDFKSQYGDDTAAIEYTQSLVDEFINLNKLILDITEFKSRLEQKTLDPVEHFLNEFSKQLGFNTNVVDLIKTLLSSAEISMNNLDNFSIDSDLIPVIKDALNIINLFEHVVEGAKTDNINAIRPYGFNYTLNEVHLKSKTEGWLDLATIDENLGNDILKQINLIRNRLNFYAKLYELNTGKKLKVQERSAINTSYLFYKKSRNLVEILPDDWVEKEEFKLLLDSLELHKNNYKELNTKLNDEQLVLLEKERIQYEVGINNLFRNHLNDLKEVAKKITLYKGISEDLLTETVKDINDVTFWWYLASRAAVNSNDFYYKFKDIIYDDLASIPTLELAVYNDYAAIVNGDVISLFLNALTEAIKEDFVNASDEEVKLKLKTLQYSDRVVNQLSPEYLNDFRKYGLIIARAPRYSNIILTLGGPGTGKTLGVTAMVKSMLNKYHKELLSNVWVGHTDNKKAKQLADNLELSNSKALSLDELMNLISNERSSSIHDVIEDENHIIRSNLTINESDKAPSLIIIDEVSHLSTLDLDLIDKFALKYGITVLVSGDMDLSGVKSTVNFPLGKIIATPSIKISQSNLIHAPKLGISMRTSNNLMNKDLNLLRTFINTADYKEEKVLHYYLDENKIYGNKVYNYGDVTKLTKDLIDSIILDIKIILNKNPDATIGYIFESDDSDLYKAIEKINKDGRIKTFNNKEAQGLEGDFYIIEQSKLDLEDLYTGISRARIGTIVAIDHDIKNEGMDSTTFEESYSKEAIKLYSTRRKNILNKVVTEGKEIVILNKTKNNNIATNPAAKPGLDIPVEVTVSPTELQLDGIQYTKNNYLTDSVEKTEDRKKKVDKESESAPIPLIIDNHLNLFFYSFNTFTPGVIVDQNEINSKSDDDILINIRWGNDYRIDSLNGLRKLRFGNRTQITKAEYKQLVNNLAYITSILVTETDKSKAVEVLQNYLKREFNLDFSNLYITFAIKTTNPKETNSNWDRFHQREEELLFEEYIYSNDINSKRDDPRRSKLIAIIGNNNSDKIEIPLFTLSSPITVLLLKDAQGLHIYPKAVLAYNSTSGDKLKTVIDAIQGDPHYAVLEKLCNIYRYTGRGILYIDNSVVEDYDNWVPANGFKSHGLQYLSEAGELQIKSGFNFNAEWVDLKKFKQDPRYKFSKLLSITNAQVAKSLGLKAGYTYILMTQDPRLNEDLGEYYERQLKGEVPEKVKIYSLLPPKATFEQYIDNLYKIINKGGENKEDIGNEITSYRLLSVLFKDNNFKTQVLDKLNRPALIDKVKEVIDLLDSLRTDNFEETTKKQLEILTQQVDDSWNNVFIATRSTSNNNLALTSVLDNILKSIVYEDRLNAEGNYDHIKNTNNMQAITNVLSKVYDGVFYNTRFPILQNAINHGKFIEIVLDDSGTSIYNGKEFLIHGKIDSTVMSLEDNLNFLTGIVNKMKYGPINNQGTMGYTSTDNGTYLSGNSNLNNTTKPVPPKRSPSEIANEINRDGKKFAIIINGKVIAPSTDYFTENGPIHVDSSLMIDGNETWLITKHLNDGITQEYTVVYDSNTNKLSIRENSSVSNYGSSGTVELLISDDNFYDYLIPFENDLADSGYGQFNSNDITNANDFINELKDLGENEGYDTLIKDIKDILDNYEDGSSSKNALLNLLEYLNKSEEKQEDSVCKSPILIDAMIYE